ncbi:MAG: RNA polymerase sigma factor SigZ [Vicinamibacterales bacterium]
MPANANPAADEVTPAPAGESRGDFSAMWADFAAPLRAFLARRVPPAVDPDDVLQDVFLRVVKHLPSLRDADRIEAWLFQIARNALRDRLRARRRRDARTESLEADPPTENSMEDDRAAEAELTPCLAPMIAHLEEPYRRAIELTALRGLTQSEAAKHAGVSVSGMKSRVQRAREQLKTMLLRCCEVEVDSRGAIANYQVRETSPCSSRGSSKPAARRCVPGTCAMGSQPPASLAPS